MRVVMMTASLEEKKIFISMFNIAHTAVKNIADTNHPRYEYGECIPLNIN